MIRQLLSNIEPKLGKFKSETQGTVPRRDEQSGPGTGTKFFF